MGSKPSLLTLVLNGTTLRRNDGTNWYQKAIGANRRRAVKSLLKTLKTWAQNAFHLLRVIEEGVEYRFEDYALDHLKRLEQRVTRLEQERTAPGPGSL